jgi:tRNA A-37 threonylcarbamoyl transferase component Bud32
VIGSILEKYEVLEKVGEGGMATVYRGRHTTIDRTVAVKVMHPHLSSSEKNRSRFAREARAIETLVHPNILRIFDYSGPTSEQCFIVTEFIEGPTLSELLEEVGAMMPEPACLVAVELCRALAMAHEHGIVHRDLKPENVMFHADGSVKLMDFGIARLRDDVQVTMTGALVGSPAYMSPEQATSGEPDARSDLFSLGTVLYRMVTGTLPFRGSNPSVVLKNIIDCAYADPEERAPSLSAELAAVIRKLLSRDIEARYASANDVRADLEAALRSVHIDPDAPGEWSVLEYLGDAEGYEERLRTFLIRTLTDRGRVEVETGRPANALRTFNRVLALDEDNREVVAILEGMRPALSGAGAKASWALWLAPFLLLAAAVAALSFAQHEAPPPPPPPELHRIAPVPMLAVPVAEEAAAGDFPVLEATPAPESTPTVAARPTPPRARPTPTPRVEDPPPAATPEPLAVSEPVYTGAARLKVVTYDRAVQVFVDGEDRGWTPMKHVDVPAGRREIRLVSPFTRELTFVENVPPWAGGDPYEVARRPEYKPSVVRFSGFPPGTRLKVDGRERGEVGEPVQLDEVGRDYTFTFELDGKVIRLESVHTGIQDGDLLPGNQLVIKHRSP